MIRFLQLGSVPAIAAPLALIALLCLRTRANGQADLVFKHLTADDGLSISTVISIAQDSTGFMWFGAKYALNKYDGQSIKVYHNQQGDKSKTGYHKFIRAILTDRTNHLWVGSNTGLDWYDPGKDDFETALANENVTGLCLDPFDHIWATTDKGLFYFANGERKKPKQIPVLRTDGRPALAMSLTSVLRDVAGNLWLGTLADGVWKGRFVNGAFRTQKIYDKRNRLLSDDHINCITEDRDRNIWIGTKFGGLNRIDTKTDKSIALVHANDRPGTIVSNNVRKVKAARDGRLWVATLNGLSIIEPRSLGIANYTSDPEKPNSLSQNSLYDIVEDRQGCMWIASYFGGVNIVYTDQTPFKVYKHSAASSISSNIISDIKEDARHDLWIGTEAGGLNHYDRAAKRFTHYENNPNEKNTISSNLVKCIRIDKQNEIWIGTSLGGLNRFSPEKKTFHSYQHDDRDSGSISFHEVSCLLEDSKGRFWVGTTNGLNHFFKQTGKFKRVQLVPGPGFPPNEAIYSVYEDRKGDVWASTEHGLHILKAGTDAFARFNIGSHDPFPDHVNCFFEDKAGQLWLGTFHGGLKRYDKTADRFVTYSLGNGLSSDLILGILEDDKGFLWLSTDKGLCKCRPEENYCKVYNTSDGLPSNEFNINSFLKAHDGEMFFGGYNGLVSFFPDQIQENRQLSNVVFTELKLFNNPVAINGPDGILGKNISYTDTLYFRHDQNVFSIHYSCLNYIKPSKNHYAHKLEGFEKEWNYVNNPIATYTNLSEGTYYLKVKGCNNDRVWNNDAKTLTIIILPPPWRTGWAYLLYVVALAAAAYAVVHFLRARAKLKKDLFQEHMLNERQEYIHRMKLEFFTNISHELRTPLTLIKAPIELLAEKYKEETQTYKLLGSIKQNSDRLLRLVGELMDFRKAESGNLVLHHSENDFVHFIKESYEAFRTLAEKRDIDYRFECKPEKIPLYFDTVQMEKVVFNLLSNAFKYAPNKGEICVAIAENEQKDEVELTVTDNGIGISKENQAKLFHDFYQVEDHNAALGTGIGLAFSRNIVAMHKGGISVDSTLAAIGSAGHTTFKVTLKKGKKHLDNAQIKETGRSKGDQWLDLARTAIDLTEPNSADEGIKDFQKSRYTVLVIEDNPDIKDFIVSVLERQYNVPEAENGKTGLALAQEEIPDLIICDVMMPDMNGLELCAAVKTDERTNHIPVILLTAMTDYTHRLKGLQIGADDYVTKPFDIKLLLLKIENLLTTTENIRKKYIKKISVVPTLAGTENEQAETENRFLEKLGQLIEDNLSNTDFGVDQLAHAVFMSRSVLYKKVAALTDMTVADFIKTYRLKKAALLLKQNKLTIAEVAFEVGFGNRKYFSLEFKKHFGVTPSAFLNQPETGDAEP